MSKSIEVENLNIYYGSFLAVEDVTMTIRPQTVTALIGPSGCGKSTFLRSINRMHEVIPGARVEGKLALDGRDLYGPGVDPVGVRRQVGMVFQRPNPFPTMSIYDNVIAGMRLNNKRSTSWSRSRCAARTSGRRSRTGSRSPAPASPAASSSACASPARSPCSPTCC
jgi:phosphate transport system ATP-binding protein